MSHKALRVGVSPKGDPRGPGRVVARFVPCGMASIARPKKRSKKLITADKSALEFAPANRIAVSKSSLIDERAVKW